MIRPKDYGTFIKYNRRSDVRRCPAGRAKVRTLLDMYAQAAVNLYGVISCEELADIFNRQNEDKTNANEIYTLLLPCVFNAGLYCFYKEYIVHNHFFDDFSEVEYLLLSQEGKPRYVPGKYKFLKYGDEHYDVSDGWLELGEFIINEVGYGEKGLDLLNALDKYMFDYDLGEFEKMIEKYGSIFDTPEKADKFFDYLDYIDNNSRLWENKGYTESEILELSRGDNDTDPCSGNEEFGGTYVKDKAYLSDDESNLFYDIWYGLLDFVNKRKKIAKAKIEVPLDVSPDTIRQLRETLWDEPELIDDYINERDLPQEHIDILKSWRNNHRKGLMYIIEYRPDCTLMVDMRDNVFAVKGITEPTYYFLRRRPAPFYVSAVLIPFKGKIIHDVFIYVLPKPPYNKGMDDLNKRICEMFRKQEAITSLE